MHLLDLFCGAGGAAKGYQMAGFTVTGVDNVHQKRYCGEMFIQEDAMIYLEAHGHEYDAIHASPPCQHYSAMGSRWPDREHPDLVATVRELLIASGKPYVIENVPGAPLRNPIILCGSMFDLQTRHGSQLRRHRLFETNFPIPSIACRHTNGSVIGVYGGGQHPDRRVPATIGVYGHAGGSSTRDGLMSFSTADRRDAMGIAWMSGRELSQAIPPAYTHYVGLWLKEALR